MSDNSKISVIIPNFNHSKYLEHAIKTSLHQSVEPYEIVVVDDGSTDNSVEIIGLLQQKYPKVQLVKNGANYGYEYSLNRGVEASQGDYLVFRSADDITLPGFFEQSLEALETHPEAALCASDVLYFEDNPEQGTIERLFAASQSGFLSPNAVSMALAGNAINPSSVMCRRSMFTKEGGFEQKAGWHCDWLLFMTMAFRYGMCYIPEALSGFRLNPRIYNNVGEKRPEVEGKIFNFLLENLSSKQRELLPFFIRSGALAHFGQKLLDHVFKTELFWRPEVLMLLQHNLYGWNENLEETSLHIGTSGVLYEHLMRYQSIIEGHAKIALYGAGEHTRLLLKHWEALKLPQIHCILTTEKPSQSQYLGIPLMGIDQAPEHDLDLVLISSKAYAPELAQNCREHLPGVRFLTFWG